MPLQKYRPQSALDEMIVCTFQKSGIIAITAATEDHLTFGRTRKMLLEINHFASKSTLGSFMAGARTLLAFA
jgi:hypothetical protein